MSNQFDYPKLSTYINAHVDRKIRAVAMAVNTSTGYFKSLINQANTYMLTAQSSASSANNSATVAASASAQAQLINNNFTSTYLGIQSNDPTRSSLGNLLFVNSFYIRASDNRLRVVTAMQGNTPVWNDAQVAADPATVIAAGTGVFLSLSSPTVQTVTGDVTFSGRVVVPRINDWTSQKATPAIDVKALVDGVTGNLTNEINRAQASELALSRYTDAETNRAQTAEGQINTALTSEINRAKQAESTTQSNLVNETNRATQVEATLQTNITNETTRATNAQAAETNRATTVENQINNAVVALQQSFNAGSNANGYWTKSPNGEIRQWGTFTPSGGISGEVVFTISFPIQFGVANSVIPQITGVNSDNSDTYDMWPQRVAKDVNGFTVRTQWPAGAGSKFINGVDWFAVGFSVAPNGTVPDNGVNASVGGSGGTGGGSTTPPSQGGGGAGGGTPPAYDPLCPEYITPVLLANIHHDGPGDYVPAGSLCVGDWVWTKHEHSMMWGAYQVTHARHFEDMLWQAPNYYRATKGHPFWINNQWTGIDTLGTPDQIGTAIGLTIKDAHTFVTLDKQGHQILNHNTKPTSN